MLKTENLNAGYGKIQVLYDINFLANLGEITIIVGPNGSGKSTLLKSIMGFTDIYSGKIFFEGQDITFFSPHERVKLGITYLRQLKSVFSNLSVKENLIIAGYLIDKYQYKDRVEMALQEFPILKQYLLRKVKTLSGGERQMLAMAMALITKPKIMMLDEPTSNLAPKMAHEIFKKILDLRDSYNITFIIVEQVVRKSLEIGDKAYLIVNGRILYEGESLKLLNNPNLGKLYLGMKGN
jgi:branched-chain amino acid transport system ATP-binding protein